MLNLRHRETKNEVIWKEIIWLYVLFIISVASIYFAPRIFTIVLQISFLVTFYNSKNNYFWFALVYIIEANPGGLFLMFDPEHTFALFKNTPFGVLYFWIVLLIVAMLKSFTSGNKYPFFIWKNLLIMLIYFVSLIFIFGIFKLSSFIRSFLPWLFLFPFLRLFTTKEDYFRFFGLIFSFVPLVLIFQIYQIFTGREFVQLLGGTGNLVIKDVSIFKSTEAIRAVSGIFIPYLSIVGTIILLTYHGFIWGRNYIITILGLSLFCIYITATRSWLVSSVFLFVIYVLHGLSNPIRTVKKLFIPFGLVVILLIKIPFLNKQAELSSGRYESIILLAEGDKTAGGTLSRLTTRGPTVMEKFRERPVIGHGYSKYSNQYSDGHVGNQNMLLHMGIIGYCLFLALWLNYIYKLNKRRLILSRRNPYRKIFFMLIAFLPAIFIIHTSAQWFDFLLSFESGFTFLFVFSFASFVYNDALSVEGHIRDKLFLNI